jgi:hypothetical protein
MMAGATTSAFARDAASRTQRVELPWLPRRLQAIDELHTFGYPAEAYALLHETLEQAASALRASNAELTGAMDALLQAPGGGAPPLEAHVFSATHAVWYDVARALCERIRRAHAPRRPKRRLGRALAALIALAAIAGLAFFATRLTATASAIYHVSFPPSHAVDGLEATEWLLPDKTTGYLDVALPRRRAVRAVTLTNAHNRAHLDRGIKKGRIEVYDDHLLVDTLAIRFEKVEPVHSPRRFEMKGVEGTRVRVTVTHSFGNGGGLAEISIE